MLPTVLLVAGCLVVCCAHVGLPYLYVSADRSGTLPDWLSSMTEAIDPALWAILFPAALACIAYGYVFRRCGVPGLASRRLIRWPAALAAAFISLWAQMYLMFNSFGS
jgi:hypothetical protein